MKIRIDDNKEIRVIQEEFNIFFPFLRLEFYNKDQDDSHPKSKKIKELDGIKVRDCRTRHDFDSGMMNIFPEMSVSDLEKIFFQSFGISTRVLRKAGNIWMETTHTDSWSLEQQNREGETISRYINDQEEKRKSKN